VTPEALSELEDLTQVTGAVTEGQLEQGNLVFLEVVARAALEARVALEVIPATAVMVVTRLAQVQGLVLTVMLDLAAEVAEPVEPDGSILLMADLPAVITARAEELVC
jgi:hypothetical protein